MYVRTVEGNGLTLQVSGKLWMRSLVMRDVETKSEWSHLLGRAMAGELEGKKLKPLIADMVTWAEWQADHPNTTVTTLSKVSKNYTSEFYQSKKASSFVFGFEVNGEVCFLSMADMVAQPVVQFEISNTPLLATFDEKGTAIRLFDRRVNGRPRRFRYKDGLLIDSSSNSRWDPHSGVCVEGKSKGQMLTQRVGIMSFTRAWKNFHPDSRQITVSK